MLTDKRTGAKIIIASIFLLITANANEIEDVICYDYVPDDAAAVRMPRCAPPFRHQHSMVLLQNSIFMFGGFSRAVEPLYPRNDIWVVDLPNESSPQPTWRSIADDWRQTVGRVWNDTKFPYDTISPRAKFAMSPFEDGFFVCGGYITYDNMYGAPTFVTDGWYWSQNRSMWIQVALFGINEMASMTFDNDLMYSFGGLKREAVGSAPQYQSVARCSSLVNNSFKKSLADMPHSSAEHSVEYYKKHDVIIFFGGYNGTKVFNQLYYYDVKSDSYNQPTIENPSSPQPSSRYSHSSAMCSGAFSDIMVILGGRNKHCYLGDLWILNMTNWPTVSWSFVTTIDVVKSPSILCVDDVVYISSGLNPMTGEVRNSFTGLNFTKILAMQN